MFLHKQLIEKRERKKKKKKRSKLFLHWFAVANGFSVSIIGFSLCGFSFVFIWIFNQLTFCLFSISFASCFPLFLCILELLSLLKILMYSYTYININRYICLSNFFYCFVLWNICFKKYLSVFYFFRFAKVRYLHCLLFYLILILFFCTAVLLVCSQIF